MKSWNPDKELLKALEEDEGMTGIEATVETDDYGIGHYMIEADSPVSGRWKAEAEESHPRDWKWEEVE